MDTGLARFDTLSMVLLGLFGIGHCLGMCGPLIMAFPARVGGYTAHLWYHFGRIVTYALVGAAMGAVGGVIGGLGAVAHVQVGLGGLAAVFLLIFGLARIGLIREPKLLLTANPAGLPGFQSVRRVSGSGRPVGMLPLGLVMGLLPCGLSYAAFARALPSGSAAEGGLLLAAFGLGTLPGLLLLGTASTSFIRRHRALSEILSGTLMVAMAVDLGADVLQAIF